MAELSDPVRPSGSRTQCQARIARARTDCGSRHDLRVHEADDSLQLRVRRLFRAQKTEGRQYMKRYGLASAVAVGLVVGTLVVSCSGDSNSTSPTPGSTVDALGPGLAGGGWSLVVAAAASKSDKVRVCHSGNGKHFTQINISARGARAHLGDPTTGKGGHNADYRVSSLTPCPPPATPGTVEVCKVADLGVAIGSTFNFALTSDNVTSTVTVAAGAGPNGTCVPAGDFRVGTMVTVKEASQTDVETTNIVVSPA